MNASQSSITVSNPVVRGLSDISVDARKIVALGRTHRWPFQVLGQAPTIEEPVRLGDWLLVPAQQDSTPIPDRAIERIQAIFAAGIRPQGFVLVHEAPKLLKAPVETKVAMQELYPPRAEAAPLSQSGAELLSMLGSGLAAMASMIFPMLLFVAAAAMADPILVAITEDNYWIEIDRWWTE
jgi:hypothetical protein